MQVLARLVSHTSDRAICRAAHDAGLDMLPLSKFAIRPLRRGGLVLGFAAVEPTRTRRAVGVLREVVDSLT
jgi:GntR family transcriptional regulator/MocR family aminotransferase